MVTGQTVASLWVDRVGLGPAGKQAITTLRVLAALLAVAGVVVSAFGRGSEASIGLTAVLYGLFAGVATAIQYALNGRIGRAVSSALVTSSLNFAMGFTLLSVFLLVNTFVLGHPIPAPPSLIESPELWLGGPIYRLSDPVRALPGGADFRRGVGARPTGRGNPSRPAVSHGGHSRVALASARTLDRGGGSGAGGSSTLRPSIVPLADDGNAEEGSDTPPSHGEGECPTPDDTDDCWQGTSVTQSCTHPTGQCEGNSLTYPNRLFDISSPTSCRSPSTASRAMSVR